MLDWHRRLVWNVLDGYPVEVAVADAAAQATLSSPRAVRGDGHLEKGD